MIASSFDLAGLLVSFVIVTVTLALPIGILFLLYKIYIRLKHIEEKLDRQ